MTSSLIRSFGWPTLLGALAGFGGAAATLLLDELVGEVVPIPSNNARALLAASFGAVVTVGAFSFWMRPVAAQLSVAALPPQLLADHLHDRFQSRIIAATVGVLGFLAVTLLAVPSDAADPAPAVSTIVGMVLTTGALAALLLAMHQAARSLRPHSIVAETAQDVIRRIRELSVDTSAGGIDPPDETPAVVVVARSGWVTNIDTKRLVDGLPAGGTVRLETHVGAFVVEGWTEVASVWPMHAIDDDLRARLSSAVEIGDQRSEAVDLVGSIDRFLDIGVHAATTSSAAPSTVEQALSWTAAILHELGRHDELRYPDYSAGDGRTVVYDGVPSAAELADHVADRLRRATASDHSTTIDLCRIVTDAERSACHVGQADVARSLRRQLDLMNDRDDARAEASSS